LIDGNRTEKKYNIELLSIKTYLKRTSNDFNFRINYLSAFKTKGEIKKANLELESSINCFVEKTE
jgi:hypothetical protein